VFTHLPESLEREWLTELRRVTRRGGYLIFTVQSDAAVSILAPAERDRFDQGELVDQSRYFLSGRRHNLCDRARFYDRDAGKDENRGQDDP
jgi:hypothetical protein